MSDACQPRSPGRQGLESHHPPATLGRLHCPSPCDGLAWPSSLPRYDQSYLLMPLLTPQLCYYHMMASPLLDITIQALIMPGPLFSGLAGDGGQWPGLGRIMQKCSDYNPRTPETRWERGREGSHIQHTPCRNKTLLQQKNVLKCSAQIESWGCVLLTQTFLVFMRL